MSKEPKWQNDWPVPSTISQSSIHLFANSSLTIPLNDESTKENMDAKLEGVTTSNLNYIRARRTKRSFEASSEATVIPPIPYYLHSYLRALGPKLTPQLKEILDATETPDDHDAPRNRSPHLMPPYETWFGQQGSYGIEQEPPIEYVFTDEKNYAPSRPRLVLSHTSQVEGLVPAEVSLEYLGHLRPASHDSVVKLDGRREEDGYAFLPSECLRKQQDTLPLDPALSLLPGLSHLPATKISN
ncbi:hypothetical protein C8J55DRAFT_521616 [Lentinula edodes]|uniref:Uncharacterized protein n=1 Tax=Lentinula lateritia TaxID=40482 RepID=A0A9W8ZVG7_9AGAR|nr:hypothetical protein C8J55DRAFT_525394 [Lentinula edodes]KAJ4471400.1 hypothetical protein C8J55DRAFT_521616 [Lentinula edodes]